jgi:hypothetical protein
MVNPHVVAADPVYKGSEVERVDLSTAFPTLSYSFDLHSSQHLEQIDCPQAFRSSGNQVTGEEQGNRERTSPLCGDGEHLCGELLNPQGDGDDAGTGGQ